jgi:hypothetical protein
MTRSLQQRIAFQVLLACLALSGCSLLPGASDEDDGDSDDGDDNGGGKGGSGGGGNSACSGCADAACSNEASNCDSTAGCRDVLDCILGCDATDATCQVGCVPQTSEGATAYAAAATYYSCAITSCYQECVAGVGGSSGGGGTSGAGGSAGDAGSGNTGAGGANGGTAGTNGGTAGTFGGSAGSAGSTGGSAGATGGSGGTGALGPGVHWLSIEGSWADISAEPNGALGISGALYAFGDSCAQITWNEATRCVTGSLCDPGANFENWGIAVGFDFHNTGAAGVPPNTKMPWNAGTVNARGVAYEVTGTAPALQAWITNMDPMWNGMCTADDCGINGPPDGTASATLGMVGNLYFNTLQKDDWGGTGTVYTFNPANILSLQFKLASVASGPVAFNFCVSRIGIVI